MYWTEYPMKIQAYDSKTDSWYHKEFQDLEEFTEFCKNEVKLPGEYNLSNTKKWQEAGLTYTKTCTRPNFEGGYYTKAAKGSHAWKSYWDKEKDRVKRGVIYDRVYIPPFYYWYLNFCPIMDDVKKKKRLGDVWDSDLWFFQLIMVALLTGKHIAVVKARQRGYSYKIMALLYWCYCWHEGSVNTIGASKEDYVDKSWRFLESYRNHINAKTNWKRGPARAKSLEWLERTEKRDGGFVGLDSKIAGTTFKTSPENGVGGPQSFFFYEEAGIAPTMMETVGFVRPAVEKGNKITGLIICSGAVGQLEHAEPLKKIFYKPEANNFLALKNIWDKNPDRETCAIFVSEAYNLEGFMDSEGNSKIKEALEFIAKAVEEVKNNKDASEAQLDISQKPTSPEQAFAQRTVAFFPVDKIDRQQEVIKIKKENGKKYKQGLMAIKGDEKDARVVFVPLSEMKEPPVEMGYPVDPTIKDKRGVVTIFHEPEGTDALVHFAGVDTIESEGQTNTSESLLSVHIVEREIEVHYTDENGETSIRKEGGRLMASYCGRFNDIEDTNEQAELLIRFYNAYAAVERNKPNFINHMKRKKLAVKHLIKRKQLSIYKDVDLTGTENDDYGIYFGSDGKAEKILMDTVKEDFLQVIDVKRAKNAEGEELQVVKTIRGLDSIEDYYLLEEAKQWKEGKNADRLRSYGLARTASMCFELTYKKKVHRKAENAPEMKRQMSRSFNLLGGPSIPSRKKKRKINLL